MKKLLFVFSLAFICTVATSSFNTALSANEVLNQTTLVASADADYSPEEVKKEEKKQKQAKTSSCCQAKAEKAECTEKQQKDCPEAKADCPKKDNCKKK